MKHYNTQQYRIYLPYEYGNSCFGSLLYLFPFSVIIRNFAKRLVKCNIIRFTWIQTHFWFHVIQNYVQVQQWIWNRYKVTNWNSIAISPVIKCNSVLLCEWFLWEIPCAYEQMIFSYECQIVYCERHRFVWFNFRRIIETKIWFDFQWMQLLENSYRDVMLPKKIEQSTYFPQ